MASQILQFLESEELLQAWAHPVYHDIIAAGPLARESFNAALYQTLNLLNSDQSADTGKILSELSLEGEGPVSVEEFTEKLREALELWPGVQLPPSSDPIEATAPVEPEVKDTGTLIHSS